MYSRRITGLKFEKSFLKPNIITVFAHLKTCPTQKQKFLSKPVCPGYGGGIQRAKTSGPCRFGFLPEEWFTFFYPKTGVTGSYLFGIGLINYWLSKEIYVMEHEYYLGLSIGLVVYYITTTFGRDIGKSLDAGVDAIEAEWKKERTDELNVYKATIKDAEDAQERACGQSLLMQAKKENIAMQIEAVYRERMMIVYRTTKGRMDYHVKKHRALAKIQQKWMITWILENVRKSITPQFEQQALDAAIRDLAEAAGKS